MTVKGLITLFKTFAISKIIQLTLITCILSTTVEQLNLIEKNFIWQRKQPTFKIVLIDTHKYGGPKNANIFHKIVS